MYEKINKKHEIVENFTRTPCLFPEKWYTDIVFGYAFLELLWDGLRMNEVSQRGLAARKVVVFTSIFMKSFMKRRSEKHEII